MSDPDTSPIHVLPDGSAFMTGSFPLPQDHWLYQENTDPPISLGQASGADRLELADKIRAAGRYAIRGATMSGKITDFDPDALLQNLIVGLIGYWGTLDYIADRDPR
jgi:hypothetical protein